MEQRISKTKYKIYAFDVESHNDDESIQKGETSIWLATLIDENSKIDDESSYFYNMDSVIDKIEELSTPKRKHGEKKKPIKNVCIYIYNLSFEWSFILPVLLKRGFVFAEHIDKEDEYCFNSVSTRSCSSVWMAQLKFSKKSGIVIFRDLAKIYGGGLDKVAKAFNLPTQKGEIDYKLNRLHGYTPTKEEKEYCFKDTRIIIDILLKIIASGDREFWQVSSMATYATKKMIKMGYPREMKPYQAFRKDYPDLCADETKFLRAGVGGGITYAPSRWQFKDIKRKILHIDAHQMHPSQAYFHRYPYGVGEYFKGEPSPFKICCCRIRISYDYVLLHSVIKLIGLDFVSDMELVVWDFEIPTMKKVYVNLKIEYVDGYAYNAKMLPWRRFYSVNYNKRLEAKKRHDEFYTLHYKLLNNSSYGKLLEKPHNEIFENCLDENECISSIVRQKELNEAEIQARFTYIPVGSAIPAYSRVCLIETALKFGWKKIVYFDTDSIFCLYDEETKKVWDSINQEDFLGGWGLEEIIDRAQFTAPKRYKTETNGIPTIKAGGINFNAYKAKKIDEEAAESGETLDAETRKNKIDSYIIPYDEVNIISSSWQVQRAYRVKGGTIIEFQTKTMEVQPKYKAIYQKNIIEEDEDII